MSLFFLQPGALHSKTSVLFSINCLLVSHKCMFFWGGEKERGVGKKNKKNLPASHTSQVK